MWIVIRQQWGQDAEVIGLFADQFAAATAREMAWNDFYKAKTNCKPKVWMQKCDVTL